MVQHNLASEMVKQGHRPFVIVPFENFKTLRTRRLKLAYRLLPLPPKLPYLIGKYPEFGIQMLGLFFSLLERLFHFDVWHCFGAYPLGVGMVRWANTRDPKKRPYLIRTSGADIQVSEEMEYGIRLDPKIDRLVRYWLPQARCVVATSSSMAQEYELLGIPPSRIIHIPNGVDTRRFSIEIDPIQIKKCHGIPIDHEIILSVGRNHKKKGYDGLIKAFGILLQSYHRDITLVIAGGGLDLLIPLIKDLDVQDRVRLLGPFPPSIGPRGVEMPAPELVALYKAADVFAFPSSLEGNPNVLNEAMCAGLPVISADSPGCRDIVKDEQNGLLVSMKDAKGLEKALRKVMEDAKLRERLSQNGKISVTEIGWRTIAEKYLDLYRSLVF